jgi:hypothetical protein
MTDPSERRSQIISEFLDLCNQQSEAMKDATFLGWTPESKDAYGKCTERIARLRKELDAL